MQLGQFLFKDKKKKDTSMDSVIDGYNSDRDLAKKIHGNDTNDANDSAMTFHSQ